MRVMMAMSGGVDSSVAAHLVQQLGHQVTGVTMKLWGGESDTGCCAVSDVEDARRVSQQLGIDHHVFNFGDQFQKDVVDPYVDSHRKGLTPNPCIECNRKLKFHALLERSEALGFDAVATGHHARIFQSAQGPRIARGLDDRKDQSYVLYPVRSQELTKVMFPLGEMHKSDVREIAADLGLRTAEKAESQDVCFITRKDGRASFLEKRIDLHSADVVNTSGEIVGTVPAVETVTIGQRRGIAVSGNAERNYVIDVDTPGRVVTIGTKDKLLSEGVRLSTMVWAHAPMSGRYLAQTSAHGGAVEVEVIAQGGEGAELRWLEPQRRIAAGQSVVIYDGDSVIGGGIAVRT